MNIFLIHWLLALVHAIQPQPNTTTTDLKHYHSFTSGDYQFSMSWQVEQLVRIQLKLISTSTKLNGSWVGIGFGKGMLDARFIISTSNLDGTVDLNEYSSKGIYDAPDLTTTVAIPTIGGEIGNIHVIEFTRDLHDLIDDYSKPLTLIWAFRPSTPLKALRSHLPENRGLIKLNLIDGSVIPDSVNSYSLKQIHGYGMLAIVFGVYPFGIFVARYLRSKTGWLLLKTTNQSIGSLFVFMLIFLVLTTNPVTGGVHSILGLTVAGLVLVQIVFGVSATLGMSNDFLERHRSWTRIIHLFLGWTVLLGGVVACGFGINTLFPFRRFQGIWYVYFSLIAVWIIIFVSAEVVYRLKYKSNPGYKLVRSQMEEQKQQLKFTTKFTWETLDEAVLSGRMYVVAHGKYVYDVSKWINSHPGGQIILQAVCGTDITNDYFHEAGFDAAEFTQKSIPNRELKRHPEKVLSRADSIALGRNSQYKSDASSSLKIGGISFEMEDWVQIQKARRVHVHSKLAIQKLSSMMVGYMVNEDSESTTGSEPSLQFEGQQAFSSREYRRYALTRRSVESSPETTRPFVRLRFCVLYPYDFRAKQPRRFYPGQCIEIEIRLPDGKRVSRFYTPLNGDLNCFDIIVKYVPGGRVSNYLFHSRIGECQFKIRGPFGTPISPGLGSQEQFYDKIYAIVGGSGITPIMQLIHHLILPVGIPLRVGKKHDTFQSGELYLEIGDYVEVVQHFTDGWVFGTNIKTGEQGLFELSCVVPVSNTRIVLFHIAESPFDRIGQDYLDLAKAVYPQLLQVENLSSAMITGEKIGMHLDDTVLNAKIVICGPAGMNQRALEVLRNLGGNWSDMVTVLDSHHWN